MLKQGNEEFEATADERKKTLTVTFRNNLKGILRVNSDTFERKTAQEFLDFMKAELIKAEKELKRRRELIDNMVEKKNNVVKDLKKQGIKLEATLSPELQEFKKKIETISNWQEVYGKPLDEIKKQEEAIEQGEKTIEFQRQKIVLVRSAAKCLDLK